MSSSVAGRQGVVRRPSQITVTWLTEVLRSKGLLGRAHRVREVAVDPVGTGQMADTVRLAATYEPAGAGPATLVGKFASEDPRSRATGRALRAYEAEVRFYGDVAGRVTARVPGAIFCAFDSDEAWFTLLVEDVGDAAPGDQIVGCDADTAAAALEGMAGLHGPCWEAADLAGLEWLHRTTPRSDQVTAQLVAGVLPGFLERYGDRLSAEHLALIEAFISNLGGWLALRSGPRTLVHGDYRLDNLLFPRGPGSPVVVDFQTVIWGPAAYDLAYFIGGCLTEEVRHAHEAALVAEYHRRLGAGGVVHYPLGQLQADYRRESLGGVMMAVGASMMVQQTERGDEMFVTSVARHAQHALDLDALALVTSSVR